MPVSITVRQVPEVVRDTLAARARQSGRSLQEYLRLQLVEMAATPDTEALFAGIRQRKATTRSALPFEEILALRDADRR